MAKCEFCDKGVTFGIKVSQSLEAQCQAREGYDQWYASPCVRLYPVSAFR